MEHWLKVESGEQGLGVNATEETGTTLPPATTQKLEAEVMGYIRKRKRRYQIRRQLSVAALSIGLFLSYTILWKSQETYVTVRQSLTSASDTIWRLCVNNSDTMKSLHLPDQSSVKIYPYSQLRYKSSEWTKKRDVFLEGVAHFSVAKDSARPFTVNAKGIAATALGTAFTIDATKAKGVTVNLHEGKVVVRLTQKRAGQAIYLKPGDQLTLYNTGTYQVQSIKHPTLKKGKKRREEIIYEDSLSFNNTPMALVLECLEKKFSINIQYDRTTVKGILVTARFTERDRLPDILNILCTLNALRWNSSSDGFAIQK